MWVEACTEVLRADPTAVVLISMFAGMASQIHSGVKGKQQALKNKRRLEAQASEALMLERRRARFATDLRRSKYASTVSLSSPTAIDVMASTAAYQEAEAQRAVQPYYWEAEAQETLGEQHMRASTIGATGTMLSGTSNLLMRRT